MCIDMRLDCSLSKCLILAFGNISIQNHDSSIYKKSNCGKTLNSMYYATCRQRVCGQNKDNLSYASTQRAHSYDTAVHLTGDQ